MSILPWQYSNKHNLTGLFPAQSKLRRLGMIAESISILAVFMWAYGVSQSHMVMGDNLGLISSLQWSFYISLGLMLIAFFLAFYASQRWLMLLQIYFFVFAFWLTPLIVGGIGNSQPTFLEVSMGFGGINYIREHGLVSAEGGWALNWPMAWIFYSILFITLGSVKPEIAVALAPTLWQLLTVLVIFLLMKKLFGEKNNCSYIATLLFVFANWVYAGFLNQATYAYVVLLFVLLLLLKHARAKTNVMHGPSDTLLLVILLVTLPLAHFLSSLVCLAALVALRLNGTVKNTKLVFVSCSLIAVWTAYSILGPFRGSLTVFLSEVFRIDRLLWFTAARLQGSQTHSTVVAIRMLTTVVFVIGGLFGFIKSRKSLRLKVSNRAVLATLVGIGIVNVFMGAGYGTNPVELIGRIYLFGLFGIAYFGTQALKTRRALLITLALLSFISPFLIISRYGNQSIDYTPDALIIGGQFFETHVRSAYIVDLAHPLDESPPLRGFYTTNWIPERYDRIFLRDFQMRGESLLYGSKLDNVYPIFVSISLVNKAIYKVSYGDIGMYERIQQELNTARNLELIYSNPAVQYYYLEGYF